MRYIITCIALFILATACKKSNLNIDEFSKCHIALNLDSTKTAARLTGTWVLNLQRCGDITEFTRASKSVIIKFNSDGSFAVTENSTITTQGVWNLLRINNNYYRLSVDRPSRYLSGAIFFCSNKLLLHDSPADGCDLIFERSN